MKRISETLVAAAAFVTALGGTLIGLPLILDAPALAANEPAVERQADHFPLPSERIEARLAYIKTALKITDAQTPQWNAFAEVLRRHAKEADKAITEMRGHRDDKATVIDRLEFRQKMMVKQAAALEDFLIAAKPLYASLSDEQKKSADELLAHRLGHGRWEHPGGWGHEGMGQGGMGHHGMGPDGQPPKP